MPERVPRGLVATLLVLEIGLGLGAARLYLSSRNTLANNGSWRVTKAELAEEVMGARSFRDGLQPLAGGRLNLAAWHGWHEVVSARELAARSVELDFQLTNGGYLVFELARTPTRVHGVRLSRRPGFPSMLFKASRQGEFLHTRPLRGLGGLKAGVWHRLRADYGVDGVVVKLNERRIAVHRGQRGSRWRLGFRAGKRRVLVDRVRIALADGRVLRDDFDSPAGAPIVYLAAGAGLPLGTVALLHFLRRRTGLAPRRLLFYFLMFVLLLIVLVTMVWGFASYRKRLYPKASAALQRGERAWVEQAAADVSERIRRSYPAAPRPGTHRLLFIGSSQSAGAGAAKPAHTIVARTERLLNARSDTTHFECVNAAVRAYRVADMVRQFRARWIDLRPATVVLNAGNNDMGTNPDNLERDLAALVEASLAADIQVVLVLEPNSVERLEPNLDRAHGVLRAVGESYGVPVIDMHAYLASRYDDGFLWWDWVHLTSFGQRLFAEYLVDELARRGVVEVDPRSRGTTTESSGSTDRLAVGLRKLPGPTGETLPRSRPVSTPLSAVDGREEYRGEEALGAARGGQHLAVVVEIDHLEER